MCLIQRRVLWDLRNEIIQPFGETAQQVFSRISIVRDSLDGPQVSSTYGKAHSSCPTDGCMWEWRWCAVAVDGRYMCL